MQDMILEVKHLSKAFGTNQVLKDIDFTVKKGDVTSIIGASGSGKSTLLRCINLLETPTSGEILYHGENVAAPGFNATKYRSHVGMVFQSFKPNPGRSPAARSSAWPLPGPWPWSPRSCSSTSPPPRLIRRWWARCSASCSSWPERA